jgi:hypothetical protein
MGKFADTAIGNYCLSFADQGKLIVNHRLSFAGQGNKLPFFVSAFQLQKSSGNCRFPFSEFRKHGDIETKRPKHSDMETWKHGDMETWRHENMETSRHGD